MAHRQTVRANNRLDKQIAVLMKSANLRDHVHMHIDTNQPTETIKIETQQLECQQSQT